MADLKVSENFSAVAVGDKIASTAGGNQARVEGAVVKVWPSRFQVEFPPIEGLIAGPWRRTFRRLDGRSVGDRLYSWAWPVGNRALFDRATVRGVLDLLSIEGAGFSYNEANNYGVIECHLFTGAGDPWKRYRGEEETSSFGTRDGGVEVRGTGRFRLNEAAVDRVVTMLAERAALPKTP